MVLFLQTGNAESRFHQEPLSNPQVQDGETAHSCGTKSWRRRETVWMAGKRTASDGDWSRWKGSRVTRQVLKESKLKDDRLISSCLAACQWDVWSFQRVTPLEALVEDMDPSICRTQLCESFSQKFRCSDMLLWHKSNWGIEYCDNQAWRSSKWSSNNEDFVFSLQIWSKNAS